MYHLPQELQRYIYEYDDTYKEKYNKIIKKLNELPKFISFIIENNEYKCSYLNVWYYIPLVDDYFYIRASTYKKIIKISFGITFNNKMGFYLINYNSLLL